MRRVSDRLLVELEDGLPGRVVWRGRPYRVRQVEARWQVNGRWWLDKTRRGICRRYFRLTVQSPGGTPVCMEVYAEGRHWMLCSLAD